MKDGRRRCLRVVAFKPTCHIIVPAVARAVEEARGYVQKQTVANVDEANWGELPRRAWRSYYWLSCAARPARP